jgi:VanZ family protein
LSLRRLGSLWGPVVLILALLFFVSSQSHVKGADLVWDKLAHAVAYGLLGLQVLRAFHGGLGPLRSGATLRAALFTVGYGVTDEFHQSFVPGRDASVYDVLADAVGFVLAAVVLFAIYDVFPRVTGGGKA